MTPFSLSKLSWLFLKGSNNEFPYGLYLVKGLSPFILVIKFSEGKALSQCTEAIFLFDGSCDSNLNLCSQRNTFQMFTYCLIPDRQSGKKKTKTDEVLLLKVILLYIVWKAEIELICLAACLFSTGGKSSFVAQAFINSPLKVFYIYTLKNHTTFI